MEVHVEKTSLTAIANALREKNGSSDTYKLSEIPNAISEIETGITPTGELSITENGTYNVTEYASADVNVSGGSSEYNASVYTEGDFLSSGSNGSLTLPQLIKHLPVSDMNTSNWKYFQSFFRDCKNLTSLDLSSWNTGNAVSMYSMFSSCSLLTSLNVSNWNVSNVTDMNNMFENCYKLSNLNLSSWIVSNKLTSISSMFSGCSQLINLDLNNFDTSNVSDLRRVFYGCSNLVTLNISNWNTSKVYNISNLFQSCNKLGNLDIGNWNLNKITWNGYMGNAFKDCTSLTNTSLNSILKALSTAGVAYTLKAVGFTETQATTCTGLSNWAACEAAGWTTGY